MNFSFIAVIRMFQVEMFLILLSQNFILLFKELPLHLWLPESHDMHVIQNMLMEHPLSSCENLLARVILSGLNWGTKSEVRTYACNLKRIKSADLLLLVRSKACIFIILLPSSAS